LGSRRKPGRSPQAEAATTVRHTGHASDKRLPGASLHRLPHRFRRIFRNFAAVAVWPR